MTVKLRQRKKGNRISLFLEYYSRGRREYEYLQLYLHPEPAKGRLSKEEREQNKATLALAESICYKRHLEIKNGQYGFASDDLLDGSFIAYVETLAEQRKESKGNYGNWDSALKHLRKFSKNSDVLFRDLTIKWLERFREYLRIEAKTLHGNQATESAKYLSQNSQYSYFSKIRAAIRQARKEGIIKEDPTERVESIKMGDPQREFLTHEELTKMAKADCEIPILKSAFLFSALTGLRWSDVHKLTWSDVHHSKGLGNYIRFRQKKTKGAETLPISEDAVALMGQRGGEDERVFIGLKYSAWYNVKLQQWAMRAGISKTITFHCARHTYATLQLTLGTDIFTVSKMLGHKDLKTTQIYAKVIDEKKKEAANRIKLSLS